METTEKIVEAYVRYVKGWATIPNLRCAAQKEIDLFAIDPVTDERWHIETSVSISSGFSKLSNDLYEPGEHKHRVKAAGARRKLGFFMAEKFLPEAVNAKLALYGCKEGGIRRAIVTWDCKDGVIEAAKELGIEVWLLPTLMGVIAELAKAGKEYFSDDTLRTITLFAKGAEAAAKPRRVSAAPDSRSVETSLVAKSGEAAQRFFIYENWTHKRARLHRGDCAFCKDGNGSQSSSAVTNGRWLGPFASRKIAADRLAQLKYENKGTCGTCAVD
jgi:hypothetical protein